MNFEKIIAELWSQIATNNEIISHNNIDCDVDYLRAKNMGIEEAIYVIERYMREEV